MASAESLTTPFRWRTSLRIHSDHHCLSGGSELEHSTSNHGFKSWVLWSSNILDRSSVCKTGKEWLIGWEGKGAPSALHLPPPCQRPLGSMYRKMETPWDDHQVLSCCHYLWFKLKSLWSSAWSRRKSMLRLGSPPREYSLQLRKEAEHMWEEKK